MMKRIFQIIALLFIVSSARSQAFQKIPLFGWQLRNLKVTESLQLPTQKSIADSSVPAIGFDSTLVVYNPVTKTWSGVKGGGDSVLYRNDSLLVNKKFVAKLLNLDSNQTVTGKKTFTSLIPFNFSGQGSINKVFTLTNDTYGFSDQPIFTIDTHNAGTYIGIGAGKDNKYYGGFGSGLAFGNTSIGYWAGNLDTVGKAITSIGTYSLTAYRGRKFLSGDTTVGADMTFVGYNAAGAATSGSSSVGLGNEAGFNVKNLKFATLIGAAAYDHQQVAGGFDSSSNIIVVGAGGMQNHKLDSSIAVGSFVGSQQTGGKNLILFGDYSGKSASGDLVNTTIIGHHTFTPLNNIVALGSANQNIIIGNDTTMTDWLGVPGRALYSTDNGNKVQVHGNLWVSGVIKQGNDTIATTQLLNNVPTQPATDSSAHAANTAWVQSQNYLSSLGTLPSGAIPYSNGSDKFTWDQIGLSYNGQNLQVGHGDFYSYNGISLNDGRGTIGASGYGMQISTNGGTPSDASKHIRFYNGSRMYLDLNLPNTGDPAHDKLQGTAYMDFSPGISDSFDLGKSGYRFRNIRGRNLYADSLFLNSGQYVSTAVANATYATISALNAKAGLTANTFTDVQTINDGNGIITLSGSRISFNVASAYFQNQKSGGITFLNGDNIYLRSGNSSTTYASASNSIFQIYNPLKLSNTSNVIGRVMTIDSVTGVVGYRTLDFLSSDLNILKKSDTVNQRRIPYLKWVSFGDSFTAAGYHYRSQVDSTLHLTGTVSFGISGATIKKQSLVLDSIIAATPAYFTNFNVASLLIGVNDFALSKQLGTREDLSTDTTYAGFLKHFIETILTSNPNIDLYIMTPPEGNSIAVPYRSVNSAGWTLKDLSVLIAQICSDYGVNCIDLYDLAQFNLRTIPTYTADGLHPVGQGSKVLAQIISNAFINRNSKGQIIDAKRVYDSIAALRADNGKKLDTSFRQNLYAENPIKIINDSTLGFDDHFDTSIIYNDGTDTTIIDNFGITTTRSTSYFNVDAPGGLLVNKADNVTIRDLADNDIAHFSSDNITFNEPVTIQGKTPATTDQLADLVTTNTNQTLTGQKTFTSPIIYSDGSLNTIVDQYGLHFSRPTSYINNTSSGGVLKFGGDNLVFSNSLDSIYFYADSDGTVFNHATKFTGTANIGGDGYATANSTLQTKSFSTAYRFVSVDTVATKDDYTLNGYGTVTITLPDATTMRGRTYVILNSGAGTVTINTTLSQTFDNITGTPVTLSMATKGAYTVQSTGASWVVINKF